MIEKRVLSNERICSILQEFYDIKVKNIEAVGGGSAEIYKIISDNVYILKLYQSKYKIEEVKKEIDVINYLHNDSFIVPTFLKNKHNEFFVIIENRVMTLQKFISGISREKFEANLNEIKECGYLHGLLVKKLQNYSTDSVENADWFDFDLNIKKLQKVIEMGDNPLIVKDLTDKINIMKRFKYDIRDVKDVTWCVSHGDFSYLQFIYGDNCVKAIIDFIRVKKLPICWEIIRSYSYMDKCCKDGNINIDNLIAYIKEFQKNVKLKPIDLKMMPIIYVCQLLRSAYGYKEFYSNSSNGDLKFAHFRTELCKKLYNNAEEISRRLQEII